MQEVAYPTDPRPKVWDPETRVGDVLSGKRGRVVGIANENSVACGCAARLRVRGAELVDGTMERSPARRLFDTAEGGRVVAFLVGSGASGVARHTIHVDASLPIVAQS